VMTETAMVSWAAAELGGAKLGDARLNRRLVQVAERLGGATDGQHSGGLRGLGGDPGGLPVAGP